jgi:hypothetical protein
MRITEREARAVWPGTFLVEDEMEKERNIDYSKIDFKQCELPEWKGKKLFAEFSGTPRVININSPSRCWTAQKNAANKWHLYAQGTIDELKELDAICQKVDAFIESELARIKLEEEYSMSAEQACEFLKANPGEHELAWVCLDNGIGSSSWNRFYSGGVQQKSLDMWVPSCSAGYRYRLIESRPAVKRVVKMTCLELCRRMVAEPGREFQVAGQCKYRFNPTFCAIEYSRGSEWVKSKNIGLDSDTIDVELNESEAANVEKPETVIGKSLIVASIPVVELSYNEQVECRDPLEVSREIKVSFGRDYNVSQFSVAADASCPLGSLVKIRNPRIVLLVDDGAK